MHPHGDAAAVHAARCVLCQARAVHVAAIATCTWCGARWPRHTPPDGRGLAVALAALMRPGEVVADPAAIGGVLLDDYTFRMAALGHRLGFAPAAGPRIPGHSVRPARGHLAPLWRGPPHGITLAVLAAGDDPALPALAAHAAPHFAGIVAIVDPRAGQKVPVAGAEIVVAERRLERFDDSRNAANALARTPWVFHLDTDETLPEAVMSVLQAVADLADAGGIGAVGLPRENIVDGVLSDLYPDPQYRLVRRTVRFVGRVHERPDICTDWTRTMLAPIGAIRHRLTAARVAARRARYDAMGQDAERAAEADLLSTPFRP